MGHNTLESRGFYADATWCDTGEPECTDPTVQDGYRLWPEGNYRVRLLVDGVVIAEHYFLVIEFPRPMPWMLDMPEDRPQNYGQGTQYYSAVGQWPSGLPYGEAYYLNNLDCIVEGLCSVEHPWEYRLPWGSSGGAYEVRPYWGDYAPEIGAPLTAPYPNNHPGFDFVYPWCPRLDWCYQGSQGEGDPCLEDQPKECVPDSCDRGVCECDDCCDGCDCGGSCYCVDWRECAWIASCAECTIWEWRRLGPIGSGTGRNKAESKDLPIVYGSGFNVDNSAGDYRSGAGTRGLWDRDNTELFQMAGDSHLLVDHYLGVTSRCKDKRGTGHSQVYFDDNRRDWFDSSHAYHWLAAVRGGHDATVRKRAAEKIPELDNLSTAQPSGARVGDGIMEVRECEVILRERLKEEFFDQGHGLDFTGMSAVLDEVKALCADAAWVWNPEIVAAAGTGTGENFCPNLGSGVHQPWTTYRLVNGDGNPDDGDGDPTVDQDFELEENMLVLHWEPGVRGTGLGWPLRNSSGIGEGIHHSVVQGGREFLRISADCGQ